MNYNEKEETTNYAKIAGQIVSEPTKSHEIDGENFYEFSVRVNRLSEAKDIIPVTISERTLMENQLKKDDFVEVEGEYRSYNKFLGEKSRLILHLFAKDFHVQKDGQKYINEVKLTGFICKPPVYRKTPFDKEICDVLLAINRANYRKSDYIPCILWGRNARFLSNQDVGCKVELTGRIQSREYNKELPNGERESRTAYEVSCQTVSILGNITNLSKTDVDKKAVND